MDSTVVTTTKSVRAKKAKDEDVVPKYKTIAIHRPLGEDGIAEVEFIDDDLINAIQGYFSFEESYDTPVKISCDKLFAQYDRMKMMFKQRRLKVLSEVMSFLESENKVVLAKVNSMKEKGVVSFTGLQHILSTGSEAFMFDGTDYQGVRIVGSEYQYTMFGAYLVINYSYVTTNGRELQVKNDSTRINQFDGTREITKLHIQPMTDEVKAKLEERGRAFKTLAIGSHYQFYTGFMQTKKWWFWEDLSATGRVMIDAATYGQFNSEHSYDDDNGDDEDTLNDTNLWMSDIWIKGFSFKTKAWGRFRVSAVSAVQFRNEAFDQLVLDPAKKDLIKALVTNTTSGFTDLIDGKGGGCIFLLHGEPGTGKTLTAEAVAELLTRPLYSVSVGELGTTPETLEEKLRQILDLGQIWNAIILLDEGDIFLEKRTEGDILRNAMVGVFLRLLEYHQGVLFITTNRVRDFDPAFHSRISIALKYAALDKTARQSIWANLLAAAKIDGLDAEALSHHDINGRQIKSTIRLAQALAKQEGVAVAARHVQATLDIAQQFKHDVNNSKSW